MNISGLFAIIFSFVCLVGAFVLEGGHPQHLLEPTAALIVFGGTIGAVVLAFPFKDIKRFPGIIKTVFKSNERDLVDLILFFKDLSLKTRKNGLLSIEGDLGSEKIDAFTRKGLQLVVDGVEPQTLSSILELEVESTSERHRKGAAIFEAAGGFSPTMGVIGTVMGLVHVLGNLSDPGSLGPQIAVAFVATLYGVAFANVLFLPMGNLLKAKDDYEVNEQSLIIEAVLLIQTGISPNTLTEKLKGFLNKKDVLRLETITKVADV